MPVKPPFLAFVSDAKDTDTLKQFAAAHGWADSAIMQGDVKTATQFLKDNTSPVLLLVEIPSAAEAAAALDALAAVCDPETKVIVTGSVNEYSFYCWLMDIGIFSYLLKPLTVQTLEGAYGKSQERAGEQAKQKPPAKLITFMGTRGGVGATTLAINTAGLLADLTQKHVALIDLDPHEGSVALSLDLEPSRGFREALEKPDRIDSLFIERVMTKPHDRLSILSAEESVQERVQVHEQASDALLKEVRDKFDIVVLDVPRHLTAFTHQCLAKAEHVVMVTELSLLSLRDALRHGDLLRESLKLQPAIVVANRVGMVAKHEMKKADFEKGINATVSHSVPFAPDIFMPVGPEIPSLKHRSHASMKPLLALAEQLDPEAKATGGGTEKKSSLFSRKKKDSEEDTKKKKE